jgi:polyphosphate kinase
VFDEALENYLADNTSAWELRTEGRYDRVAPGPEEAPYSAQAALLAKLCT